MTSNSSLRRWSTVAAIAWVLAAAAARVEASQYKLSGSVDGTGTFLVDDNLDVYLNNVLISTTNVPAGTPAVRSPITINANIGDTLRFEVRDTFGVCSKLSRLILTDAVGRFAIADPGFDLGCGFPPTNQGVTHVFPFVIPVMPDLPPFDDRVLPGSTLAGAVPGPDSLLYGVTYDGGVSGLGSIYSFDPAVSLVTLLHSFDGVNDGSVPYEELALDPVTGRFYGTTRRGGLGNAGTVFEFDPSTHGLVTFNVDFAGYTAPQGPLVVSNGFLYGTLRYTNGAVFRMATDGTGFTVIHAFSDVGANPNPITLGPDGLLYGTTTYGGGVVCNPTFSQVFSCGDVFRLTPVLPGDTNEQFQTLYVFQDTTNVNRNNYPQGQLIYGSDGFLYGTTYYKIFRLNPNDPNPTSTFQFVWSDGRGISLSAIEGADHRLYGADYNGPNNAGRIFVVDRNGANPTDLHTFSFTQGSQSNGPYGRLFRNAVGTVYGTTEYTTLSSPHPGTIFAISGTGVNPPSPPVLSNVAVTSTINENDVATLTGQISDPDPASTFTLTINWGDGGLAQTFSYPAGTTSFSQTHRYLDDNPTGTSSDVYTINLTLTNSHSASDTDSASLTVNNVAPGGLAIVTATPSPIVVGVATTMSFTMTDVGSLDTHTVVFNWGDGTPNTTVNLAAGVLAFNVTHTFVVSGNLSAPITWSDDDLGSNSGNAGWTVNPLPPPPVLSNVGASALLNENDLATVSGQMTAAPASPLALTINWGDASSPQTFNFPAGTTFFSQTHRYLDDTPSGTSSDSYTITFTLTDIHGGTATATRSLTVFNVPPVLSNVVMAPTIIFAGESATLSGTITDVGSADAHTVVIDWRDARPMTTINLPAGVTTFSATHLYTLAIQFNNISVVATDDDGGFASGTTSLTVNPLPPAAPSNLIAVAVSKNQIDLRWTDNSNSEYWFELERCDAKARCFLFAQIATPSSNVTTFSNTGLAPGTRYVYRVRAYNPGGTSTYSNTAGAKTPPK